MKRKKKKEEEKISVKFEIRVRCIYICMSVWYLLCEGAVWVCCECDSITAHLHRGILTEPGDKELLTVFDTFPV